MRIPKEMLPLSVTMQLTRSHRSDDGAEWRLELTDEASRQILAIVEFDSEVFADLMSHRGGSRIARARWNVSDRVGKQHENQTVLVPFTNDEESEWTRGGDYSRAVDHIYDRAAEMMPGWFVDTYEGWNHHRESRDPKTGARAYAVTVRRWV